MAAPPPPQQPNQGQGSTSSFKRGKRSKKVTQVGPDGKPVVQMMPKPEGNFNCPPGLEYLTQIDQILIHQQIELLEILTGFETQNKYVVKNSLGQQIYFAAEESDCCERQCCGPARGFVLHITDNLGQEVIRIVRQFKCCAGCGWCADAECCAMDISIEAPPGNVVGRVRQKKSSFLPFYTIRDTEDNVVFHVEGPKCCICQSCCCTDDIDFNVLSADRQHQVGKISKQWAGMKEFFTDADHFSLTFPMDLDVKMKACMMGAMFLLVSNKSA